MANDDLPKKFDLETHMGLHLAQTFSSLAPRGGSYDFKDADCFAG